MAFILKVPQMEAVWFSIKFDFCGFAASEHLNRLRACLCWSRCFLLGCVVELLVGPHWLEWLWFKKKKRRRKKKKVGSTRLDRKAFPLFFPPQRSQTFFFLKWFKVKVLWPLLKVFEWFSWHSFSTHFTIFKSIFVTVFCLFVNYCWLISLLLSLKQN